MARPIKIITTPLALLILSQTKLGCSGAESDITKVRQTFLEPSKAAEIWPVIESSVKRDEALELKVGELLQQMSVEEKVGQIMQAELKQVTPEDVKAFHLGSILNGGGTFPNNDKYATPADWVATADAYYDASMDDSDGALAIPIIWGTDAVHGHNNVIGATLFPHNIGLGAARNPELIEQIAAATSAEVAATGIDWIFAPTVATVRNDLWGRTYEGYSEDPEIVKAYAGMIVSGMQGRSGTPQLLDESHLVSTAKHFVGDGGTAGGIDRGDNVVSEQELFDIHAQGYVTALEAGVQTVMAVFNSWPGEKLHGSHYLLTEVLKDSLGFDGFVVGDWNGHQFVEGCSSVRCPQAINAGLDLFMASEPDWKILYKNTLEDVKQGVIPAARLDDAVSRILRVKMRAGLFDSRPSARPLAAKTDVIGSQKHRDIARQAVRESLVLLKNKNNLLPLDRKLNVLVAGDGADNIGKQSGGWTLSWQGTGNTNEDFPGASSIYAGIEKVVQAAGGNTVLSESGDFDQRPDVAIVVYGENPYAEGQGDLKTLEYQAGAHHDLALLKKFKSEGIPVVSVFISGRPLWVNAELNASDAFVAAWLPGSEGDGVAEVMFKAADGTVNYDFTGKLSFSWPKDISQTTLNRGDADYQPLFPYGYGLGNGEQDTLLDDLTEELPVGTNADLVALEIFNRRAISPWKLSIKETGGQSVSFEGNRAESSVMSILAVDKMSQEDSRKVTWLDDSNASVVVGTGDRYDLSPYLSANAQLVFDVRTGAALTSTVVARVECGSTCSGEVDISDELAELTTGEWTSMRIELKCFANDGVDFSKVNVPFSLLSSSSFELTFSNVSYVPNSTAQSDVSCQ